MILAHPSPPVRRPTVPYGDLRTDDTESLYLDLPRLARSHVCIIDTQTYYDGPLSGIAEYSGQRYWFIHASDLYNGLGQFVARRLVLVEAVAEEQAAGDTFPTDMRPLRVTDDQPTIGWWEI